MPAGYSGTPLVKKLGIKEDASVLVVNAPNEFAEVLGDIPTGATVSFSNPGRGPFDVIVYFTKERAAFEKKLSKLRAWMAPACGLWIAWPKKASKVETDMTEQVVRDAALPTGLVDNKVCAIDAIWSGLRLVIRLENRK